MYLCVPAMSTLNEEAWRNQALLPVHELVELRSPRSYAVRVCCAHWYGLCGMGCVVMEPYGRGCVVMEPYR